MWRGQDFRSVWEREQQAPRERVLATYTERIDALAAVLDEAVAQSPEYSADTKGGR